MREPVASPIRDIVRQLARQAILMLAGIMVLAILAFMADDPVLMFFKLLSLAGTALMLLSVVVMLLTFRRARVLAPSALITSLGVSLISTLISLALSGAAVDPVRALGALAGGSIVGGAWASTMLLFIDDGLVRGRGTPWHLAIWAISFAANQIAAVTGAGNPYTTTLLMLASAGLTTGHTVGLTRRIHSARALVQPKEA